LDDDKHLNPSTVDIAQFAYCIRNLSKGFVDILSTFLLQRIDSIKFGFVIILFTGLFDGRAGFLFVPVANISGVMRNSSPKCLENMVHAQVPT